MRKNLKSEVLSCPWIERSQEGLYEGPSMDSPTVIKEVYCPTKKDLWNILGIFSEIFRKFMLNEK